MSSLSRVKSEVFRGWWIVLICSIMSFYGVGVFFYGFSALVNPVTKELGWSMVLVSGAFSLYRLEAGIAAPLVGFLLDRYGPRRLVMAGTILMGGGFIYLSQVKSVVAFYLSFIIISFGFSFSTSQSIGAPLISKWFVRRRGKALGLYFAGMGLGGFLVPLVAHLITLYGWRLTLLIMGPLTWLFVVPLSLVLKHRPEDEELLPDGESPVSARSAFRVPEARGNEEIDFPVRKSFSTPAFWIFVVCFSIFQMTMSAMFVHLIPHLIKVGIEARLAALAVAFVTTVSVAGRLGFGWLADFVSKKWLLLICFFLQLAGIFVLMRVLEYVDIIPFLFAYGLSYGGIIVLRPSVVGAYYGRKNFGTIWGTMQGISIFGGLSGPVLVGLIYDLHQSYDLALIFLGSINMIPILSLLFLKRPVWKGDSSLSAAEVAKA